MSHLIIFNYNVGNLGRYGLKYADVPLIWPSDRGQQKFTFVIFLDVLQFDNTFSWLKSKSLSYYVDVVETDKYIEENAKDVITADQEAHGE